MKLYYCVWNESRDTSDKALDERSAIMAKHPLNYKVHRVYEDETLFLRILWWQELTHEEILEVNEHGGILDPVMFQNYMIAHRKLVGDATGTYEEPEYGPDIEKETSEGCICQDCERHYRVDLVVPQVRIRGLVSFVDPAL